MRCSDVRRIAAVVAFAVVLAIPPIVSATDPNPPSIHGTRGAWPLLRQWTPAETRHMAAWFDHLYERKAHGSWEQQFAKLERMLTDPEINLLLDPDFAGECNPQLDAGTMRAMHSVVDCAKLTVALHGYYAYRRGLPWVISVVGSGDGTDIRTAGYTIPRASFSCLDYPSPYAFFTNALMCLCTGNYRVDPHRPGAELSDTVPVALTREFLIPGCTFYLDGHVLIVGRIDESGEVRFLDSTTDPSREIYAFNRLNAVTGLAAKRTGQGGEAYAGCFRGFRVHRYPIAETDDAGNVTRIRRRTDDEMRAFGYSLEQYDRLEQLLDTRRIVERGIEMTSFHEFVRFRMRSPEPIDPAGIMQRYVRDLLDLARERAAHVQQAWDDVQTNGPIAFPQGSRAETVFNSTGRWGAASSASMDAVLRCRYIDFISLIEDTIAWYGRTPERYRFATINAHAILTPSDLAKALEFEKNRLFREAVFTYRNSKGQPVRMSLLELEQRLYDISFDPNHPPEIRWGAKPGSPEAADAPETPTPVKNGGTVPMAEAYRREAYYRTLTWRDPEASELERMATEGFPTHVSLDSRLRARQTEFSPPLVPRGDREDLRLAQHANKMD